MAEVEMIPVNSELLSAVGFNPETGEGRATFAKNGKTYSYPNCTQAEFDQILNGAVDGSNGKTFNLLWKYKPGYAQIG